ncbi:MAG: hypothetical protein ACYTGR_08550 [Planctomycetota bacterium]
MKHTKGTHSRLWAEWCFLKACGRHYRTRLVILGVVVVIGTLLFRSDGDHTLAQAAFSTFSLIFGELPEEFPDPGKTAQRVLFFLLPLIARRSRTTSCSSASAGSGSGRSSRCVSLGSAWW